jgi:hypothetical protein
MTEPTTTDVTSLLADGAAAGTWVSWGGPLTGSLVSLW